MVISESGSTVEVGPFTGYSKQCGFPDPRNASPANVRAALHQIVRKEGPLTKASIFRLYMEGSPDLQRAGKAVRRELNRSVWAMQRAREIVQEDELGDRSPEGFVIRLAGTPKVRERPAGRRDLPEIPPSELLLVLDRICASAAGSVQDDNAVSRALLDHYGFTRLTEVRRRHLDKIVQLHRIRIRTSESVNAGQTSGNRIVKELRALDERFENPRCSQCSGVADLTVSSEGPVVTCASGGCKKVERVDVQTLQRLAERLGVTCYQCKGTNLESQPGRFSNYLKCRDDGANNSWQGISERIGKP